MLRVAVLGAGFAGGIHAQAWAGLAGTELTVVDPDGARAAAVAERWGAAAEADVRAALAEGVDAVSVCAPTGLHPELAIAAARAGKHVLCEKPLALTLADCDRITAAAREAGVTLMVGHVLRFWPEYDRLRELAAGGELGELRSLTMHRLVTRPGPYAPWMLDPGQSLGLGEVAIHDLDLAAALVGRPHALTARGVRDGAGWRQLHVLFHGEQGDPPVSVHAGWGTPAAEPFAAGFRAVFDYGVAEYDSRHRPTLRIVREDGVEEGPLPRGATEGGPWAFDATPYLLEVEEFARCLAVGQEPARCTPADARQAVELVLAATASAASGATVELPPAA